MIYNKSISSTAAATKTQTSASNQINVPTANLEDVRRDFDKKILEIQNEFKKQMHAMQNLMVSNFQQMREQMRQEPTTPQIYPPQIQPSSAANESAVPPLYLPSMSLNQSHINNDTAILLSLLQQQPNLHNPHPDLDTGFDVPRPASVIPAENSQASNFRRH